MKSELRSNNILIVSSELNNEKGKNAGELKGKCGNRSVVL